MVSQQIFGLGDKEVEQKRAAVSTIIFVGSFLLLGCGCFWLFNAELKRSKLEKASSSG